MNSDQLIIINNESPITTDYLETTVKYCFLPTAYCILLTAYCLLRIDHETSRVCS